MTFLDRARQRAASFGAAKAQPQQSRDGQYPAWLRAGADSERWNLPDLSTVERQADLYTKLAWIQIAVQAVAETVATTPLNIYRLGGAEKQLIKNHPFVQLLQSPNPLQSRFEFLAATVSWLKVTGNCYWFLNRPGEQYEPAELWIVPSHQIQPVPDGLSFLKGYLYTPDWGQEEPLETWEIVQFKTWNPLSKYLGLSPLQALMYDARGDIAAQQYNAKFYAEDNAKAAGILAFADPIDDGRWDRIKADQQEQHGGTRNKRMMLLRNVGPGGVQWIETQLDRQQMQYLEQRQFTKEEIYALYAPGLASVLAINATEANSTAGKDTFLTMAIYPQTAAIAEKASHGVLPAYGDNLVAEFDDVRRVDTQIELKEQEAYERTHTIDEVRAKYYQDAAIGDERGGQLPGQVKAPQPRAAGAAPAMAGAGVPLDGQSPEAALAVAGKALDRRRWRDKALKALAAGRAADAPTFDPEYLSDAEAMAIRAALKRAGSAEDVAAAMEA